jgi:copper chaperone CopZ
MSKVKIAKKFNVDGMTCINCKKIISKNILNINGVLSVNVNLVKREVNVVYDAMKTSEDKISGQIINHGYEIIHDA